MIISQYFCEFILYSFLGWVWESIFCTIKKHHFENRGFLFGPICPIYGFSVVIAKFLFVHTLSSSYQHPILIFFICMIGSAIIEFSTSYFLEKKYHALWWDYSQVPFNIQGRICLPVSICFGLAGVVIVKYIFPFIMVHSTSLHPLLYESFSLILAGVLGADYALTKASLSSLISQLEEASQKFTEKGEEAYLRAKNFPEEIKKREKELREYSMSQLESLNKRQTYILKNMNNFRSSHNTVDGKALEERIKEILKEGEK